MVCFGKIIPGVIFTTFATAGCVGVRVPFIFGIKSLLFVVHLQVKDQFGSPCKGSQHLFIVPGIDGAVTIGIAIGGGLIIGAEVQHAVFIVIVYILINFVFWAADSLFRQHPPEIG